MPGIQDVDKHEWYNHHHYYHPNKIKFAREKFLLLLATISTIKLTPFHWSGNCETQVTGRETLRPHLKRILQDWSEDTESATRKSITRGQLAGNRSPCRAHAFWRAVSDWTVVLSFLPFSSESCVSVSAGRLTMGLSSSWRTVSLFNNTDQLAYLLWWDVCLFKG